jgi:hypothetical protein
MLCAEGTQARPKLQRKHRAECNPVSGAGTVRHRSSKSEIVLRRRIWGDVIQSEAILL